MSHHSRRTRRQLSLQVLDDRRVLAAIVGSVFNDGNDSFRRDIDEDGLAGRLVYIDQNNNAVMDQGERYALTDADGAFTIDDMPDGDYLIRLFNGTSSQVQTTPQSAASLHDLVLRNDISTAVAAQVLEPGTPAERTAPAVLASGNALQTVAADGTLGPALDLGSAIQQITRLADGSLVVRSANSNGGQIWLIDETGASETQLSIPENGPVFESLASNDVGHGVAVAHSSGSESELWTIDTSDLSAAATGVMVPHGTLLTGDTTPRTNDGPTRSVLSNAVLLDDGNGGTTQALAISFWSHASGQILPDPIIVGGASEVVAFHDEAGLLVLRSGDDLTVHDADAANLAMLYTISDTEPVAAIDGARGLIVTLSPRSFADEGSSQDAGLRLLDSETGSIVADLAIDLSALADLAAISLDANLQTVMLTGTAGLAQLTLRRPAAAEARIAGEDSPSVDFGVRLLGENSAPNYAVPPSISVTTGDVFVASAPGIAAGATDSDTGDRFVVLQAGPATNGTASIAPNGQMIYTPLENFTGPDTVPIIVTDGRDATELMVAVNVLAIPDPPIEISVNIAPVPENIQPADIDGEFDPIGVIEITGGNPDNHLLINILNGNRVPDERFQVLDGYIVFVGPARLNFEQEWSIPLIFTVTDLDNDTTVEYATSITVTDEDDPITDITPSSGTVRENSPGEIITSLTAVDEDFHDIHVWSVDDDRFEVIYDELKLKDTESLDREAEETITLNITASFGDDSFTKAFTLTVLDSPETPTQFLLTNTTVMELVPAAVVGELTIAGNPAANGHILTVNDPRFVFAGSTLRLADDEYIDSTPNVEEEILIEITATPDSGGLPGVTQSFVLTVLENDKPFHNDLFPEDVNHDGYITERDALVIINYLNAYGPGPVGEGDPAYGYDVNNDGFVTSLDALLVINELNSISSSGGGTVGNEPGGEPTETPSGRPRDGGPGPQAIAHDPLGNDAETVPAPQSDQLNDPTGRRVEARDQALAGLSQTDSEKVVSGTPPAALAFDEAVEMISSNSARSSEGEESTDKVFGEPEVRLLG